MGKTTGKWGFKVYQWWNYIGLILQNIIPIPSTSSLSHQFSVEIFQMGLMKRNSIHIWISINEQYILLKKVILVFFTLLLFSHFPFFYSLVFTV